MSRLADEYVAIYQPTDSPVIPTAVTAVTPAPVH